MYISRARYMYVTPLEPSSALDTAPLKPSTKLLLLLQPSRDLELYSSSYIPLHLL